MQAVTKPDYPTPPIDIAAQGHYAIRPAVSFSERCHAWNIVYLRYIESRFIKPHPSALFFSALDLLPSTVCMIARSETDIAGTMSLAVNSTAGLPGGISYEGDLRRLGIDGRVVGEMTKLAVSSLTGNSTIATSLMASLIYWSWFNHIDDVVCVVHPRHGRAWTSIFGWRPVGDTKLHPGVNDQPGVLMHLDLKRVTREFEGFPARGQRLLKGAAEQNVIHETIFRPSGCEVAALLLECPRVLTNSPPRIRTGLERHFPWAHQLLSDLYTHGRLRKDSFSSAKPGRDRQLAFPNQISQRRALSGSTHYQRAQHDHLLFPDVPLILLVGAQSPRIDTMQSLLEDAGFISIRCQDVQDAIRTARENVFDLILIDGTFADSLMSLLTSNVRERDAMLDFHTLIIGLSEVLQIIQNASHHLVSERDSLEALVGTLRLIAEGGGNGPNNSAKEKEEPRANPSNQRKAA